MTALDQPTTTNDPARPGIPFGHVPALDGLRGVAVAGVLLFHAGHLRGGFLGVDLFFVLSGFLITSLLLAEWDRRGRIDLRHFWSRRFRRLLPAALVLVTAVAGLAALTMHPIELGRFRGDAVAAVADVANWRAIATGNDYWAASSRPSPLQHMWSLSIEEQLYLLWPLVLVGTLWLSRRRRWGRQVLLVVAAVLVTASAAAMAWWSRHGDVTRPYYGTDARASSVLLGALAAIALSGRRGQVPKGVTQALSWATPGAIVLLGCGWLWADGAKAWLYRGVLPLLSLAAAVLVAAVAVRARTAPTRVLSLAPLRWLGRVSYGVYLWHWPIYTVIDRSDIGNEWLLTGVRIALSLVVAAVSYHLLEMPIRQGRLRTPQWRVLAPAGAALAVGAAVLATTNGITPPASGTLTGRITGPAARSVLLLGDSEAYSLGLGQDAVFLQVNVGELAFFGCGIGPGLSVSEGYVIRQDGNGVPCPEVVARSEAEIAAHPGVTVLLYFAAFDIFDRQIDGKDVPFGTAAWDTATLDNLRSVFHRFRSGDRSIVALAAPCYSPKPVANDPLPAIDAQRILDARADPRRVPRYNQLLRQAAAEEGVTVLPLDELFCGVPAAQQPSRPDGVHLDRSGAETVWHWIVARLPAGR